MREVLFLSILAIATSCSSWLETTRKTVSGEEGPRKSGEQVKWVSKSQYDDLMEKYKNLLSEYEKNKTGSSLQNDLNAQKPPVGQLAESVDVFAAPAANESKASPVAPAVMTDGEINKELSLYRKSEALLNVDKKNEALRAFQVLQKSPNRQIRVRSRNYIAQIYKSSGQYDLALQVYEEIIGQDAFSGTILQALAGAIECCEKLGLDEKRIQYQSMLKDVFEVG